MSVNSFLSAFKVLCCLATGLFLASCSSGRNVIFMVPDGMGLSNVTAARIYKNGPDGAPLNLETLPYIGYQRTHSRNRMVTDSAAAASAWASGEKFNNGEISCLDTDGDGVCDGTRKNADTILELAQAKGMATGLVATADITHATPAVWGAHVHSRKCESEIFRQLIEHDIDVLLGGGVGTNRSSCLLETTDVTYNNTLIKQARDDGYAYVTDKDKLKNIGTPDRLLGLFKRGGLTPIYARSADSAEPTLADMTRAALNVLKSKPNGFFLMIEGSQIDWANHDRNPIYQIQETLDFDDSVKIVRDWISADETRKNSTLLIVAADHETGGVIIDGPSDRLARAGDTTKPLIDKEGNPVTDEGGNPVMAPDMTILFGSKPENPTGSAGHTAVDTIIRSNSPDCARALDNTDLYNIMRNFISD